MASSCYYSACDISRPITELIRVIKDAKFKIEKNGITLEGELSIAHQKVPNASINKVPKDIKDLATSSPNKAIERSWHDLEESATAAASISTQISPIKLADTLIDKSILTEPEAEALYQLHEIQQQVKSPSSKFITDVSSASNYSSIAYSLTEKIRDKKP